MHGFSGVTIKFAVEFFRKFRLSHASRIIMIIEVLQFIFLLLGTPKSCFLGMLEDDPEPIIL